MKIRQKIDTPTLAAVLCLGIVALLSAAPEQFKKRLCGTHPLNGGA
ncbi:MAG: hypothetical protein WB014_00900 [Methanosarcina sp.]